MLLAAAERGKTSRTLAGDECEQTRVKDRGLFLQAAEPLGFAQEILVEVEGRSHMHEDA